MRRQNHIDVTAGTAALAVGLLLPGLVAGHEHKMNNVVPGKGVSQDPIVRCVLEEDGVLADSSRRLVVTR